MKAEILPADGATAIAFAFGQKLDHAQVRDMAQVVDSAIAGGGELRLLLDLRGTEEFAVGAFLSPEGAIASIRSIAPVSRYAVVAAPALAAAAVEAFGSLLPLEARSFAAAEMDEARLWVTGPPA